MRWLRHGGDAPTPSAHRLRLGLPGYLILFAPQLSRLSVMAAQKAAFAIGVLPTSAHFTATLGISTFSTALEPASSGSGQRLSPGFETPLDGRLRALYAQ